MSAGTGINWCTVRLLPQLAELGPLEMYTPTDYSDWSTITGAKQDGAYVVVSLRYGDGSEASPWFHDFEMVKIREAAT